MKNILLYDNDPVSTSTVCVSELYGSLQQVIDPKIFTIQRVNSEHLNYRDWQQSTALLLIPGGRARDHYQNLAAGANRKIVDYVLSGGKYLGMCAGGYYAAEQTVFEQNQPLQILDPGVLNFYPGTAQGPAYGLNLFQYQSESGARLAKICADCVDATQQEFLIYYNGGCYFHGHSTGKMVRILARYQDIPGHPAAIVQCQVGQGIAVLSGVHVEFSHRAANLQAPQQQALKQILQSTQTQRLKLFSCILQRLLI